MIRSLTTFPRPARGTHFADTFNAIGFTASSANAGNAGVDSTGAALNEFEGTVTEVPGCDRLILDLDALWAEACQLESEAGERE